MQLIDGKPVYSATDLVGFLACEHLTNLDRAAVLGLASRPVRDDPELDLIAKRGLRHEQRYLDDLRARGFAVTEITRDGSVSDQGQLLRDAAAETTAAIRRGDQVIYQATFFDGRWRGHADFLTRVDEPSALGAWSYEVADTKLARTAKAGALLQLCVYSDLLAQVQGRMPTWMEVALGGSARAIERFRVSDYLAYYRAVRARFDTAVDGSPAAYPVTATYPEPVEHCDVCRWGPECGPRRRRDDHLSLVAGITSRQRRGLTPLGVDSVARLAALPLPMKPLPEGTSGPALERIHEQARLQVESRAAHRVLFELLDPIEAGRGLALLPPPSRGDLFFDMEGDPFVEEGGADGLEYLFGVIEPGTGPQLGLGLDPTFHALWGRDRAAERVAFEAFIDLVMDRLRRDPGLHIYHYGAYEPSRVKMLMGRHATREEEVDYLLRAGVFVDLYTVVRQGVRVSTESYSIKKLEPLYRLEREVALQDAGSSIINFELWLDGERQDGALLDLIEAYNRDDCLSNWKLREWLEERRLEVARRLGAELPRPAPGDGTPPPSVSESQARILALVERLTADLPPDEDRTPEQRATWLLAQLLDWHRREDKAFWWQVFAHREMTDEELIEESTAAIGGMEYEGEVGREKKSIIHRYRFPPQDNDIRAGTVVEDQATLRSPGTVVEVDQVAGTIDLKRSAGSPAPHPRAIYPSDYFSTTDQRAALLELGDWVADHGIDAPGAWRAARDLLLRRPPRAGQGPGTRLVGIAETELDAARRLALVLDHTTLAIQGPPGAGKTFTGARMIVELVRAGRRVGITATSHKVIGNLLRNVYEAADEARVPLAVRQKATLEQRHDASHVTIAASNAELSDALVSGAAQVGAGTAWVWSAPALRDVVDVLFIDEAGQMSLANVVAMAGSAKSIVLLGDPQQLEQPLKGSHPPGAEASALQHLLGEHRTMPPGLGLFLERTWRLHPDITRFTSEVFYEGRLESEPHLAVQSLVAGGAFTGTGLRWLPVPHETRTNESPEEAAAVAALAHGFHGAAWTDEKGNHRRIDWPDILVVAPYNAQVALITALLPTGARVGTVDKFQGQEAPVSIYSLTTSSPDLAPRGMEFLYSLNRLNVATSRARGLAVVVGSPALLAVACHTPRQMRLANALCRVVDVANEESGG